MSGRFVAGCFVPVKWTAQDPTAAPEFSLNVKEHSLTLQTLLHDVTGVKANGVRARIPGPLDIEGRVVLDLDLDEVPWNAAVLIRPGYGGIMKFGVSPAGEAIQVPLICEKLHFAGGTDKELMWDADFKADILQGSVIFPAL